MHFRGRLRHQRGLYGRLVAGAVPSPLGGRDRAPKGGAPTTAASGTQLPVSSVYLTNERGARHSFTVIAPCLILGT